MEYDTVHSADIQLSFIKYRIYSSISRPHLLVTPVSPRMRSSQKTWMLGAPSIFFYFAPIMPVNYSSYVWKIRKIRKPMLYLQQSSDIGS